MQYMISLIVLTGIACAPQPAPPAHPAPADSTASSVPPDRGWEHAPAPGSGSDEHAASGPGSEEDPAPAPAAEQDPAPDSTPAAQAPGGELAALEQGMVEEINRLRQDPRAFARALSTYRTYYDGPFLRLPGQQVPLRTFEGVAAVDEAIAAARKGKPARPLRSSPGLSRAARAHAQEIGRAGSIDHAGADGTSPFARMKRHGVVVGMSGENIGTGHAEADIMVMDLFIDDGVSSRGHRANLIEPSYGVVGVGCAPHRAYHIVCVMDFAEDFTEQ